jgi:hypothetical protein
MGFTLQGVPLVRERCPFRGPYPLDVARHRTDPPEGGAGGTWPPTGSCSRDESVLSLDTHKEAEPSMPSWAFPLQSVPFIRPGDRL